MLCFLQFAQGISQSETRLDLTSNIPAVSRLLLPFDTAGWRIDSCSHTFLINQADRCFL